MTWLRIWGVYWQYTASRYTTSSTTALIWSRMVEDAAAAEYHSRLSLHGWKGISQIPALVINGVEPERIVAKAQVHYGILPTDRIAGGPEIKTPKIPSTPVKNYRSLKTGGGDSNLATPDTPVTPAKMPRKDSVYPVGAKWHTWNRGF